MEGSDGSDPDVGSDGSDGVDPDPELPVGSDGSEPADGSDGSEPADGSDGSDGVDPDPELPVGSDGSELADGSEGSDVTPGPVTQAVTPLVDDPVTEPPLPPALPLPPPEAVTGSGDAGGVGVLMHLVPLPEPPVDDDGTVIQPVIPFVVEAVSEPPPPAALPLPPPEAVTGSGDAGGVGELTQVVPVGRDVGTVGSDGAPRAAVGATELSDGVVLAPLGRTPPTAKPTSAMPAPPTVSRITRDTLFMISPGCLRSPGLVPALRRDNGAACPTVRNSSEKFSGNRKFAAPRGFPTT